jgi:hypothetical protein
MAVEIKSAQELYDIGRAEAELRSDDRLSDWNEGSIADIIVGVTMTLADEVINLMLDRYNKTYIDNAEGADLDRLGKDHWDLLRQGASKSTGTLTFSRASASAGDVLIVAGLTVRTDTQPDGSVIKFVTTEQQTMTGLTVDVAAECDTAGVIGNVDAGTISLISDALPDPSITVTNAAPFAGGQDAESDSEYRESIKDQARIIRGATRKAVEARARKVPGVANASIHEQYVAVRAWDEALSTPFGPVFKMLKPTLFVSDSSGNASTAMKVAVRAAIEDTRAAGVYFRVDGGIKTDLTIVVEITFDAGASPDLEADATPILQTLIEYVNALPAGALFDRSLAEAAVLAIWGPTGNGQLTDFQIVTPVGDVQADENEYLRTDINLVTAGG